MNVCADCGTSYEGDCCPVCPWQDPIELHDRLRDAEAIFWMEGGVLV